jgi:hypothetical protein
MPLLQQAADGNLDLPGIRPFRRPAGEGEERDGCQRQQVKTQKFHYSFGAVETTGQTDRILQKRKPDF